MWAATKNLQRHCLSTLSSSLFYNPKIVFHVGETCPKYITNNVFDEMSERKFNWKYPVSYRSMSTTRGRSMRSKVEKLMRRDVGRTQKEIRRARNLRKKLMTEEERLIWNLRRAKKKVALLLQKLKKYELPELPPPRHDPELLTPEQLQAYKKIGFRNKNYVPVGVRGVFGGVVQNMHLHWKFHETVQVCCDNFPKEKIKEMATMLARLSGGIVVNVHDVKTIIMFRGRNYRQPKNLIPINTLTKRKALFKARFEQALDSQKLNIKKIEQELRRKGVNPEDPVAMASIQRVASTFFNAIDEKQGSPYVFHGDKRPPVAQPHEREAEDRYSEEQEQQQLDKFIADIEEAAEQEWEEEEAAEREEFQRIKYRNREHSAGRIIRTDRYNDEDSEGEVRVRRTDREDTSSKYRTSDKRRRDDEENDAEDEDEDDDVDVFEDNEGSDDLDGTDEDLFVDAHRVSKVSRTVERKYNTTNRSGDKVAFKINGQSRSRGDINDDPLSLGSSDEDHSDDARDVSNVSRNVNRKYSTPNRTDDKEALKRNSGSRSRGHSNEDSSGSEDIFGDSEGLWDSDDEEPSSPGVSQENGYSSHDSGEGEDYEIKKNPTNFIDDKKLKTPKQADEDWDSD